MIIIGVLILAILGACIWFFVFYTDKAKGNWNDRNHGDGDDELTELVDGEFVSGKSRVNPDLKTPDLTFNDLKGPVEFVRVGSDYGYGPYYSEEYFYSPEGEWLNIPRWSENEGSHFASQPDKYWKDADGYVVAISEWTGDNGSTNKTTLNWVDGKLMSRDETSSSNSYDYYSYSNSTTDYTYDEKGLLVKEVKNYSYSGTYSSGSYSDTYTYSYLEFDDYGNWTKRNVSDRYQSDGGYSSTNSYVEVRDIQYY